MEIEDEESDSGSTGTWMGDEDLCMLHEAAPDSEARALVFRLTSTLPDCAAGRYLRQRCVICLCTCKHPVISDYQVQRKVAAKILQMQKSMRPKSYKENTNRDVLPLLGRLYNRFFEFCMPATVVQSP